MFKFILLFQYKNTLLESYRNDMATLRMFESSFGSWAPSLPSSQFTNPLPVKANWSTEKDVESEALQ